MIEHGLSDKCAWIEALRHGVSDALRFDQFFEALFSARLSGPVLRASFFGVLPLLLCLFGFDWWLQLIVFHSCTKLWAAYLTATALVQERKIPSIPLGASLYLIMYSIALSVFGTLVSYIFHVLFLVLPEIFQPFGQFLVRYSPLLWDSLSYTLGTFSFALGCHTKGLKVTRDFFEYTRCHGDYLLAFGFPAVFVSYIAFESATNQSAFLALASCVQAWHVLTASPVSSCSVSRYLFLDTFIR
ncbi:hypothetical protein DIPPA_70069 [Diplonema papillatum]|nr:hypothetical protein DIPPA_70069 [Diplonema papillatum]